MAAIIQRTFSDGVNKGVALGFVTGSNDNSMSRPLTVGSNWNVIRMGILCGIGEYQSQSYNRNLGLSLGFSSGSRTFANFNASRTFVGSFLGTYIYPTAYSNTYWFWFGNDAVSGSYFSIDTCFIGGQSAGGLDTNSTINLTYNQGNFWIANNGAAQQRRTPFILELSASTATNFVVKLYGISGSAQNIDYTSASLLAALTGSLTASGFPMTMKGINNITHDKNAYPLDTSYVEWQGGTPFEIYDWYIYKVR